MSTDADIDRPTKFRDFQPNSARLCLARDSNSVLLSYLSVIARLSLNLNFGCRLGVLTSSAVSASSPLGAENFSKEGTVWARREKASTRAAGDSISLVLGSTFVALSFASESESEFDMLHLNICNEFGLDSFVLVVLVLELELEVAQYLFTFLRLKTTSADH